MFQKMISIMILIFLSACTNQEEVGKFIFYSKKDSIIINNYEIRETKIGNLYLLMNDRKQQDLIKSISIDSMYYIADDKKYKANLDKPNDKYRGFFLSVKNDGVTLDVPLISHDEEEMYLIGHRDDLGFIIESNIIVSGKLKK